MNKSTKVRVDLQPRAYTVHIGQDTIDDPGLWSDLAPGKVLIVSNDVVAPLYLQRLEKALAGRDCYSHILTDGEPHKTISSWAGIIDQLITIQARRDCNLIALGGGVAGDICGFAAAAYMRGVRFYQVPTTLLAQVDSSVGGKTGVNHPKGKNLIGAFHQPHKVVIDTRTLDTLPIREFRAGMAEVVKYGAIMDAEFMSWLEHSIAEVMRRNADALTHLIRCSIQNKAKIVAADEKESGIRAILNFGHTFGHAIEAVTAYSQYLHGEAVSIGMVIAATLSEQRELCKKGVADKLRTLLQAAGLPTDLPDNVSNAALLDAMKLDKKAMADGIRLILLKEMGNAFIDNSSSSAEIEIAMNSCRKNQAHTAQTTG